MRVTTTATWLALSAAALAQAPSQPAAPAAVERPAAIIADGIPQVPLAFAEHTRPYMEFRTAAFTSWHPHDRSMLISTRFGNVAQVHRVARPMGAREQITFETDPVSGRWSPAGDVLVAQKDVGGNEFFQLYTVADGRLTLITDGRSRNQFGAWTADGRLIGYSSTRRNGRDADLYIVDPRDPSTDRLVAQVNGGGWGIQDFSPDGRTAVVREYIQITKSNLHLLDVASGRLAPLGDHSQRIAYGAARFAPDGTLWVTSDEGSEFQRLGTIDLHTGAFRAVAPEPRWDVDTFQIAPDGSFIAYVINEAGNSRLRLLDPRTGHARSVDALPAGQIGAIGIAPWGDIGLTFTSARSAADAYAVDPGTLAVTRWTQSETGGLDPDVNVEPELLEVRSFDDEPMSGFLYRPHPGRFPGPRPLIISIHGGPEAQARPGFLGRNNYLLNELGIAIFFPNVRGSSGYGKRFVSLDDGPFRREDSVKDIGAFLDALAQDPGIDARRIGVTGGSYGGYMCYATAIHFGDRLRAATCIVAISNFVTFLENTEEYRRDLRRVEYGDERDPARRAKLLEISPLTRAADIRIPLMVVTGANDPRVPASEAGQIVEAVRAHGRPVWHLLALDEGHGFAKKANQDYQFWTTLMFWEQTLLGNPPPDGGLLLEASAAARQDSAITIGRREVLYSTILGEDRSYWVSLPASYDDPQPRERYPVMYLLDGDAHFHSASGVVQFMSAGINGNIQVPELIVVGIPNTRRFRDLTPTHSIIAFDGRELPALKESGGGERFLQFLREELMPRIDATYRTAPYQILVGHSLGGLFALHALLDSPGTFQAYIAIDPSLHWDNRVLVRRAEEQSQSVSPVNGRIYLAMANNGPDVGRGDPRIFMTGTQEAFVEALRRPPFESLQLRTRYYEDEDHASVPLLSLYHGLLFTFEDFKPPAALWAEGASAVQEHFARVSSRLGIDLPPPPRVVQQMAYSMLFTMEDADRAVGFFRLNVANFPEWDEAHIGLGEAYAARGDLARAIGSFEQALRLNPHHQAAAEALRRLREQ